MNYFRERAVKLTRARAHVECTDRARVTSLKNYRRLLRRAINHASRWLRVIERARARIVSPDRTADIFPTRKIQSDGAPEAYSNLYQHELKDYVINAR